MLGTNNKKDYLLLLPSLIIALFSTERLQALVWPELSGGGAWLLGLGLSLTLTLFWFILFKVGQTLILSGGYQQWLTMGLGGLTCGLAAWLLLPPAGLSRLTVEIAAEQVWSPDVLTAVWRSKDDTTLWSLPFEPIGGQSTAVSLEIIANEIGSPGESGEVWLLAGFEQDGALLPTQTFQAGEGWLQREIDRGPFQENLPAWLTTQKQATLRWQGTVRPPATLVFLQHAGAGRATIHWNNATQQIDLRRSAFGLTSVTLGGAEPPLWRVTLPWSAVEAGRVDFLIQHDPWDNFPTTLKMARLSGWGQTGVEWRNTALSEALQVERGQTKVGAAGVAFVSDTPGGRLHASLPVNLNLANSGRGWLIWLENWLVIGYIAVIGAILLGWLVRRLPVPLLLNFNLAAISLLVAFGGGELLLGFYLPPPGTYYPHLPNTHRVLTPASGVMPGITGPSNFITNAQGFRGDEPPTAKETYQILAVGGSTTECVYLDQTEAWPYLVQTALRQAGEAPVWVGNAGRSGHNSREHLVQLKHLLPQHPQLDAVIVLAGINDLGLRLRQAEQYNPDYLATYTAEQALLSRAFAVARLPEANPTWPHYTQTGLWRLLDGIAQPSARAEATIAAVDVEDEAGLVYIERRKRRQNSPIRETLPDLTSGLEEYRRNLTQIVEMAQTHDVRLILMTQPTMWRSGLTPEEKSLLWLGYGPDREYFYSIDALAEGIAAYNRVLLDVCQTHAVECLDLATMLPQDGTVFYDDVHFNEQGSAKVAEVLTMYLLNRPPF